MKVTAMQSDLIWEDPEANRVALLPRIEAAAADGAALVALPANPLAAQDRCGPVGERMIFACLRGTAGPTIVLAAGAGQTSGTWDPLMDELAGLGRVLTFDRPGLGRSMTRIT